MSIAPLAVVQTFLRTSSFCFTSVNILLPPTIKLPIRHFWLDNRVIRYCLGDGQDAEDYYVYDDNAAAFGYYAKERTGYVRGPHGHD